MKKFALAAVFAAVCFAACKQQATETAPAAEANAPVEAVQVATPAPADANAPVTAAPAATPAAPAAAPVTPAAPAKK